MEYRNIFTDLSMAVLASLGGGHLNDLAGSPFQQHKAILAQGGALHGVGGGCPGITCLEVQICICHVCCVEVNKTKATKLLLELIQRSTPTLNHKNYLVNARNLQQP